MLSKYLSFITELFPHLTDETINYDDDVGPMDCDTYTTDNVIGLRNMRAECVRIVNTTGHVNRLIKFSHNSTLSLLSIARLCHILLSEIHQKVHSNRWEICAGPCQCLETLAVCIIVFLSFTIKCDKRTYWTVTGQISDDAG